MIKLKSHLIWIDSLGRYGEVYLKEEADQVIRELGVKLKEGEGIEKDRDNLLHDRNILDARWQLADAELQKANDRIAELERALEQSAKDYCKVNNFTSELKRKAALLDLCQEKINKLPLYRKKRGLKELLVDLVEGCRIGGTLANGDYPILREFVDSL
jgi:hypothetical protein